VAKTANVDALVSVSIPINHQVGKIDTHIVQAATSSHLDSVEARPSISFAAEDGAARSLKVMTVPSGFLISASKPSRRAARMMLSISVAVIVAGLVISIPIVLERFTFDPAHFASGNIGGRARFDPMLYPFCPDLVEQSGVKVQGVDHLAQQHCYPLVELIGSAVHGSPIPFTGTGHAL
jgi:hypothetical protein